MLETHSFNSENTSNVLKRIMNVKKEVIPSTSRPIFTQSNVSDKLQKEERENVGLLSYLLETVQRKKYKEELSRPYPLITRVDMIEIDMAIALQELLLKILEWFAFIVTDILFRVIWPL